MAVAEALFEAHLPVVSLDRSLAFYQDIVGLELAHVIPGRQAAFLWIGAPGRAMLGLWVAGGGPQRTTLHVAFRASIGDVVAAPGTLSAAGVQALDFNESPTDEPVVLTWMPAVAVYFRDPDGHLLEYIAMLEAEARPDGGIVSWRDWRSGPKAIPAR